MKHLHWLLGIGILLVWESYCAAQTGIQRGPDGVTLVGFGEVDADGSIDLWAEEQERRIAMVLDLQVDRLTQECELTSEQINKLRLLSQGVAHRKVAAGRVQLRQFMIESKLIGRVSLPVADSTPSERMVISGAMQDKSRPELVHFLTNFEQPLFESDLWQGVLKANLSEEQFTQYKETCIDRNQAFVNALLTTKLAAMDAILFLTPQQAEKIRDHWNSILRPHVTVAHPSGMEEATDLVTGTIADNSLIDPFLSEFQREALDLIDTSQIWKQQGLFFRWQLKN